MTTTLFSRTAAVTVAWPLPDKLIGTQPNAIEIADLRMRFEISKSLSKDPNTCKVVITNLSLTSRGRMERRPLNVLVQAGFDGSVQDLFRGDVIYSESRRMGVDWETTLHLGDGHRAFRHARVNASFKAGVTSKQAVKEIAKSMGLKVPKSVDEARELAAQFSGGLALSGASHRAMTGVLKPHGYHWSIQNENFQLLKGDATAKNIQAVNISQDTGMIGSPEFGSPGKKGQPPQLKVTTLLNNDIVPGAPVFIDSERKVGLFRCEKVMHVGDTHGQPWYTKAECKQL